MTAEKSGAPIRQAKDPRDRSQPQLARDLWQPLRQVRDSLAEGLG